MLRFKQFLFVICIMFLSMGLASPSLAYDVDLTIPLYGQETSIYGGPACAQMIMDGYPPPYTSVYIEQSVIWSSIQSHNSGEAGWATDPEGMQGALLELNPPPGTWSLQSYDVKEDLMFQILYWMNNNSFAVTTLVNKGYHWVVVVGYETDIEPVSGSNPVLQEITLNDPWPIDSGHVATVTGTIWYTTTTYWSEPIENPGTWENKYVAIIEPPQGQGTVSAVPAVRTGTTPISETAALQFSETWIEERDLASIHPSYGLLSDDKKLTLEPILVREEGSFDIPRDANVPYYYIIPYDDPVTDHKDPRPSVYVVINAFTGDFEQVDSLADPVKYLDEEDAIAAAVEALGLDTPGEQEELEAVVVYTPCNITHSRIIPFWRIESGNTVVYVNQQRAVFQIHEIVPQLYGH